MIGFAVREFVGADAIRREPPPLVADDQDCVRNPLVGRARAAEDERRVSERNQPGGDGVDQPALFAHLVEQAGGQPATAEYGSAPSASRTADRRASARPARTPWRFAAHPCR